MMTERKHCNYTALGLCGALGKISAIIAEAMDDVPQQGEMFDDMADLAYHVAQLHQKMFEMTEMEPYAPAPRD